MSRQTNLNLTIAPKLSLGALAMLAMAFATPHALRAQPLAFEAASIKSLSPEAQGHVNMSDDATMVNYTSASLQDVMAYAYGVRKENISGPAWLDSEMYAIVAKVPAGTSGKQIPEMLQTLLRDRFGVVVHREAKDVPVFALVVAKGGPKLKAADVATGCQSKGDGNGTVVTCHAGMSQLAATLSRRLDRPVLDKTLLEGVFEINMQYPRDAPDDAPGTSLFNALSGQLGLKLEAQHAPGEFLIVDSANRIPTEN